MCAGLDCACPPTWLARADWSTTEGSLKVWPTFLFGRRLCSWTAPRAALAQRPSESLLTAVAVHSGAKTTR